MKIIYTIIDIYTSYTNYLTQNKGTMHIRLSRGFIPLLLYIVKYQLLFLDYKKTMHQKAKQQAIKACCFVVRVTGLEPASLSTPDPKSGVFANFTIPAYM